MITALHKSLAVWKRPSAWLLLIPLLLLLTAELLDWIYRHYSATGSRYAICADWATILFLLSLLPGALSFAIKCYAKSKIPLYLFPGFMVLILELLMYAGFGNEGPSKIFSGCLLIAYFISCMVILFLPLSGTMSDGFKWGISGKVILRLLVVPFYVIFPLAIILLWLTDSFREPDTVSPGKVYGEYYSQAENGDQIISIQRYNHFSHEPTFSIRMPKESSWYCEWKDDWTCILHISDDSSLKIYRDNGRWQCLEKAVRKEPL